MKGLALCAVVLCGAAGCTSEGGGGPGFQFETPDLRQPFAGDMATANADMPAGRDDLAGMPAIDLAQTQSADLARAPLADLAKMPAPDLAASPDMTVPNTIMGSVNGAAFNTVSTALLIGMPDNPQTTVVYLFSLPVLCADLAMLGWDARIDQQTQVLSLKLFGLQPAVYKVTTSVNPAPGEAVVNHIRAANPTPANKTTVTLGSIMPKVSATGSFNLAFGGGGSLSGTYNASFCPGGVEP